MTEFLVSILKVKNSTPQNMHSCLGISILRQAVATHSKHHSKRCLYFQIPNTEPSSFHSCLALEDIWHCDSCFGKKIYNSGYTGGDDNGGGRQCGLYMARMQNGGSYQLLLLITEHTSLVPILQSLLVSSQTLPDFRVTSAKFRFDNFTHHERFHIIKKMLPKF